MILLAAGLLPVPALLTDAAPAVAWGLLGAITIAAALVYAQSRAGTDVWGIAEGLVLDKRHSRLVFDWDGKKL
ncbi:hypothetical protein [Streptomyces aurantiogriseus]|uniref:Uncharacterized protein n=1 Tax=Streptomyces aurantiogriseus TaxID=66870 RepID=A0A918FFU8_9ACTN|nr:hypothetical protein [Streptomyces aurantiogriseus]GGR35374.1 hypothetical protein GCM10010251_59640 [Streptomyces aurantiogriseus]